MEISLTETAGNCAIITFKRDTVAVGKIATTGGIQIKDKVPDLANYKGQHVKKSTPYM